MSEEDKVEIPEYTTDQLIDRLYETLEEMTASKGKNKLIIDHPDVRMINKKTCIKNFTTICDNLKRNVLDVKKYFEDEMCVKASIDGSGMMLIDGRFRLSNIEKVLTNYLIHYVICKECGSSSTELSKHDRILFLQCETCKSEKAL